ncbi:hemopexin repeat-containing protein [Streptomyces venezuelae]|uniref:hemopexin repeat-containing protein n=1 Tax=Streptomyces venezuelae TaxID=54571 RepID=UPI0037A11370
MIQAAATWKDYVYLFRGDTYAKFDMPGNKAVSTTGSIQGEWAGLAGTTFERDIDATVEWIDFAADIRYTYFFKGDQCLKYYPAKDEVVRGPVSIAQAWPELAKVGFDRDLDAAVWTDKPPFLTGPTPSASTSSRATSTSATTA